MTAPEPPCPHDWSRALSDRGTPRCIDCGVPFDQDSHNPAIPDADPPIRSFDDLDIWQHERPEAA